MIAPHVPLVGRSLAVLVQVRVQSLGLDPTRQPVVVLQEMEGDRVLPIWIGPGEAGAIASQLAKITYPRPLTHDLLCSVLRGLGGMLQKVVITRVEESTYFAELLVHRNGEVISLDARPSDSIALALRVDAKIFAQDQLLEHATIEVAEDEDIPDFEAEASPMDEMDPEELKEHLRKLDPEDFGRFKP